MNLKFFFQPLIPVSPLNGWLSNKNPVWCFRKSVNDLSASCLYIDPSCGAPPCYKKLGSSREVVVLWSSSQPPGPQVTYFSSLPAIWFNLSALPLRPISPKHPKIQIPFIVLYFDTKTHKKSSNLFKKTKRNDLPCPRTHPRHRRSVHLLPTDRPALCLFTPFHCHDHAHHGVTFLCTAWMRVFGVRNFGEPGWGAAK